VQGHVAPGIYARAFVAGAADREQLLNYRQESEARAAVVSAPWLMPDFGSSPTVSMGLGR